MQVILTQDVLKLGLIGDAKNVKPGFFRNYLAPRKLAMIATEGRLQAAEKICQKRLLKIKEQWESAKKIAEKLKDVVLIFSKKVTAKNKLYGSIGEKDIVETLKRDCQIELEEKNIKLKDHLKELGEFIVPIQLTEDLTVQIKVMIEKEGTEEKKGEGKEKRVRRARVSGS